MNKIFVPYFYVVECSQLADSASAIVPLVLDQDDDFELHSITGFTDLAGEDALFRPNHFSVQVTDKNSSRIWSNARISQIAMVPEYILRRPVLLASRSNLSFDFHNLTNSALAPTITLHGFKVTEQ